jgi:hypothetical protein
VSQKKKKRKKKKKKKKKKERVYFNGVLPRRKVRSEVFYRGEKLDPRCSTEAKS